jgi:hypothetical protein
MNYKKKNNIEDAKKAAYRAKKATIDAETETHLYRIKDKKTLELLNEAIKKSDIVIKETYGNERPYFTNDTIAEFAGEDACGDHLW